MSKTDKELTVEVVNAYIQSWFLRTNTLSMKPDEVINLIDSVYNTISKLKPDNSTAVQ